MQKVTTIFVGMSRCLFKGRVPAKLATVQSYHLDKKVDCSFQDYPHPTSFYVSCSLEFSQKLSIQNIRIYQKSFQFLQTCFLNLITHKNIIGKFVNYRLDKLHPASKASGSRDRSILRASKHPLITVVPQSPLTRCDITC